MILRARRRCVSMLALALTAALVGCQNVRVKLGEPPSSSAAAAPATAPAAKPSFPNPGNIPGGQVTARRGETIYQVSQRTGAPVRDLIDANHLRPPYRLAAGRALVVPRTPTHVVQRGETLRSIAEAEGVELYSVARMNELTPPFAVTQGQVLKLPPTTPPPAPPLGKPEIATTQLPPATAPVGSQAIGTPAAPAARAPEAALPAPPPRGGRFIWPVRGRVIGRYGTSASGTHNDGINIAAPKGAPVRAADAGVVAYAGNELRGYGNLVLIKHAGGWMTAYAHNGSVLVKRGEVVKRGQEIATVGATGIVSQPPLHFEIRQGSQVLHPGQYLAGPQASAGR